MKQHETSVAHAFAELENVAGAENWTYQGVRIWPVIKFMLAREADEYVKEKNLVHFNRLSQFRDKMGFAARLALDALGNAASRARRPDVCLLTYETFRQYRVGERWFNIFQDPLLDLCSTESLYLHTFEILNTYPPRRPRLNEVESVSLALLKAKALAKFGRRSKSLEQELDVILAKLRDLSSILGTVDWSRLRSNLRSAVKEILFLSAFFEHRLDALRPKLTLLANYYSMSGLAYCLASTRCGIPSADISHGSSGEHHYAYGGWRAVPKGGYDMLPTYFLTRTAGDADAVEALAAAKRGETPLVVGDLAAHAWRRNLHGMADAPRRDVTQELSSRKRQGKMEVLVASQSIDDLPELVVKLMERTKSQCFFWIRFHPAFVAYLHLFRSPIRDEHYDVESATKQPLFALLERVDAVITETSSVAEDGLAWGVPAIIINPLGRLMYKRYIDNGLMYGAQTVDHAETLLHQIASKPRGERLPHHEDELRAQEARMRRFLVQSAQA